MSKARLLVVDDEESMRYFLTRSLKRGGHAVTAVASGEEALARVAEEEFDLVLLDLRLPGIDGLEVLRGVKERSPETQVILMTGYGTVERALSAMRKGAADFITKPFQVAEITEKVADALARTGRRAPPRPDAEEEKPARQAPAVEAPPRPITAFLVEAAAAQGIDVVRSEGGDLKLREVSRLSEILYLMELFQRTGGNVSLASRIAGISRPSLHRKIQDLRIDVERYRG